MPTPTPGTSKVIDRVPGYFKADISHYWSCPLVLKRHSWSSWDISHYWSRPLNKVVFSSSRQDAPPPPPPPRRAKKTITRDKRIKELRDRFVAGQSSLSDYILGMSHHTNIILYFRCYFGTCLDPIFVLVLSYSFVVITSVEFVISYLLS